MGRNALVVDAWIREAEEASRLLEEMEARVNNHNHKEKSLELKLRESVHWKLFELGPKIDRLESLLRNPPAKPILTDQDLELRQNMLSEIQFRTRVVAMSLSSSQVTKRPGNLPTPETKDSTITISNYDQDNLKATVSNEEQDLLAPLVTNDSEKSSFQDMQGSCLAFKRWIWKACRIIFLTLAAVALVVVLYIICALIRPN